MERITISVEDDLAESGVRHGSLNLVSVVVSAPAERHGHTYTHGEDHVHYRPRS